jgi:hypothetical protein
MAKPRVNSCSGCGGPLSEGKCIMKSCKFYAGRSSEMERPTQPPDQDVRLDLDEEEPKPIPSEPPTSRRHNMPTRDPPPEQKALRDWLAIPQSKRPPWPDNNYCASETCGRVLELDFCYCPSCGTKRELPRGVREKILVYEQALRPKSFSSVPLPKFPPSTEGVSRVPPSSASSPQRPAAVSTRRHDPRREEDDDPIILPVSSKKPLR